MAKYFIEGETLKKIADGTREVMGLSAKLSTADIISQLNEAQVTIAEQSEIIAQATDALEGRFSPEAYEKGLQAGIKQGINQGIQQGIQEGIRQGRAKLVARASGQTYSLTEDDLLGSPRIADYAFCYDRGLLSISLPASVTHIGRSAFSYCTGLESALITNGVRTIGEHAFSYCASLTEMTIPEGVTVIPSYMLYYCTLLSTVILPKGLERISGSAFKNSALRLLDCTACTSVPVLESADAFNGISPDYSIIVPLNLYRNWISSTTWSNFASHIISG